jgi:hypothetical protein
MDLGGEAEDITFCFCWNEVVSGFCDQNWPSENPTPSMQKLEASKF